MPTSPEATNAAAPLKPTKRNALLIFLVPVLCFAAAPPLGNFLGQTAFSSAPSIATTMGALWFILHMARMSAEIASVTGEKIGWWRIIIPIYGWYWQAVVLPAEVAKAKQKMGKPPPRGLAMYLFLPLYALASDVNDLAS
jgi:hypothetical protein